MRRLLIPVCGLALLAACGQTTVGQSPDPDDAVPAWVRLPDPPLSPRTSPVVAWDGTHVLVIGGDTNAPCPPNASCVAPGPGRRDGARLDVDAGVWRPISAAPIGVPGYAEHAIVAGTLYVLAGEALLGYDIARNAWSQVAMPAGFESGQLVADGDRLVVASGTDEHGVQPDRVYTPHTGQWSVLPDDPLGPTFDRTLTAIPTGLVLTGHALVPNPGADGPSVMLAARFVRATDSWVRLPDSDQLGGQSWTWTGERLVDPSLGGSDGGEVGNYGRTVPYGGILDPATGQWSRLPHAPGEPGDGWPVSALGGRYTAVAGWKYDDDSQSWAEVPRPHGAPLQPGTAVWAGDRLVVVGGLDTRHGYTRAALSRHAWMSESGATLGLARQ